MTFRRAIFVAGCLIAAGSAHAQMGGPSQDQFIPDVEVESFIWQQPAKWYPYSNSTEAKKVTMLFPTGQKPQKFKESLVFTEFSSTLGATSADQVKAIFVTANEKKCNTHSVQDVAGGPPGGRGGPEGRPEGRPEGEGMGGPEGGMGGPPPGGAEGLENGYSTSVWEETCVTDNGSQYSLNKVILGNEKLYTAKKVWKAKPKKASMEKWQETLSQVYVCDPRTGSNECVPPGGPPGGGPGGPR